jgi:hypothetical protein
MAPRPASRGPLTARQLNRATLARQGLLEPIRETDAAEAVRRLGSLQGQHPEWPPVALAARAADSATADLAGALVRRSVVRSSLMRITIHVVAAADLWPMFTVMQPLRLSQWSLLTKVDPLRSELGSRLAAAHRSAIAALRERPMSSLEIDRLLSAEVGLGGSEHRRPAWREPETTVPVRVAWRHFAAFVPLVHVPHDGEGYGRSRYALASDWLGMDDPRPRTDEADARVHLTRRYLAAFGPASINDLVAYVGRGKGGIRVWRDAVAALGDEVVELPADDGRTLLDLAGAPRPDPNVDAPPRLLARWDSVLLSHEPKHRGRIIADEHRAAVFSKNADVRPTFLVDGMVAGTWDLARGDGPATVTLRPFTALDRRTAGVLSAEAERVLDIVAAGTDRRRVELGQ